MKDPELVGVFKAARSIIECGDRKHICCAIDLAAKEGTISDRAKSKGKEVIRNLLGEYHTLTHWLMENHKDLIRFANYEDFAQKIKLTRLAWLDHLIETYSKEGICAIQDIKTVR